MPTPRPRVRPGRFTAHLDQDEIVVFLIGMRINHPLRPRGWWPAFSAMPRMIRELEGRRDSGLLGVESWFGRTILMVQYWQSFDQLDAFARDPERSHLPAWRDFNRRVAATGEVGIWHETYVVPAARVEAIHANMPPFGLLKATSATEATGSRRTALTRLGMPDDQAPDVSGY